MVLHKTVEERQKVNVANYEIRCFNHEDPRHCGGDYECLTNHVILPVYT